MLAAESLLQIVQYYRIICLVKIIFVYMSARGKENWAACRSKSVLKIHVRQ